MGPPGSHFGFLRFSSKELSNKESYWERLRWITKFLEETNIIQTEIKRKIKEDTEGEGRKKTWEEKTTDQKIEKLKEEMLENKEERGTNDKKEERFIEAQRLKRSWKEDNQDTEGEEEEEKAVEPGEEDYLGPEELCHTCVMIPCICDLRKIGRKVEMLRLEDEIKALEEKLKEVGGTKLTQKRKKEAEEEYENSGAETPMKKP